MKQHILWRSLFTKKMVSLFFILVILLSGGTYLMVAHAQKAHFRPSWTARRTPTPTKAPAMTQTPIPTAVPTVAPTTTPVAAPNGPVACTGCWLPTLSTSFQWQLQGTIDQSYAANLYDIDGFDNTASTVQALHSKEHKVTCYLSAGSWENWRSDADQFPTSVLGKGLDGWPGEKWLDIRQLSVLQPLMQNRVSMCKSKGFDAVEFDNVDGYSNKTGFPLKASDQLTYNEMLANIAHRQGMAVLLKNDPDQVEQLAPYFDAELDEQCAEYQECDKFVPFIQANKPVFEVEYNLDSSQFCPQAIAMKFYAQKKDIDLGPSRMLCQ